MPPSLDPPRTQTPTLDFTRSPKVTQGGVGFEFKNKIDF